MDKMSFGQILRETRERKGLDLNATARRLRIRPDILRAIEDSNFAAMPPRGYTRNMVNGYARYLGLNPTELTGMYLDELYAYQVDYASSHRRSTGFDMSEAPDNDFGLGRTRRNAAVEADETSPSRTGRIRATNTRTHQARGSALPNTEYTNFYSGPNVDSGWRSRLPFLIVAIIGLLLLLFIGRAVLGIGAEKETEEVSNVPVTGVSDETGQGATSEVDEPAPTKFTFEYALDSGVSSWVEVYIDGETKVSEEQTGPLTQSFDCSGTLQFICANPTGVTIKIDGEEQVVQAGSDGLVNMTVNFSDILAKWIAEHPNSSAAKAQTSNNATQATNATNTANANANATNQAGTDVAATDTAAADTSQETYDESYETYDENGEYYDQSYDESYDQSYDESYDESGEYYSEGEEYYEEGTY